MVLRRAERGAVAMEFALLLPLFLLLVFATLEYGWVMLSQASLGAAARDGCREGAVVAPWAGSGPDGSVEAAQAGIAAHLDQARMLCAEDPCEVTVAVEGERPEQVLRCAVTSTYRPLIGLLPTPGALSTTASTWLEYQR